MVGSVFTNFPKGLNPEIYSWEQCLLPVVLAHHWAGATAQPELFAGLSCVTGEMFQVCLGKQELCPGEGESSNCKNKQVLLGGLG